ncbi:hypothetical protein ABGB08_33540 [Acrocarpospora sp. B8E8]
MTSPSASPIPDAAIQQEREEQPIAQVVAGVQDRLDLGRGEDLRPGLGRLQLDHATSLRTALGDVVQERLIGRRRPTTSPSRWLHRDQQARQLHPVPGVELTERRQGRELAVHARFRAVVLDGGQNRDLPVPSLRR